MDLRTWISISRRRSNTTAIATTAILIGSLFYFDHGPEGAAFARRTAVFMIVLHGLFHGLSIYGLRAMVRRGVENAELALSLYCDPRRISHLDLASIWLAMYVAAPHML